MLLAHAFCLHCSGAARDGAHFKCAVPFAESTCLQRKDDQSGGGEEERREEESY